MELNVHTIEFSDGTEVQLRLTSKAIGAYLKTYGETGQYPLAVVMLATEDFGARASLLGGAMKFPDNRNSIKTGEDLLDLLSADGWTWDDVNGLIIQIARDAGLVDEESKDALLDSLQKNTKRIINQFTAILSGENGAEAAQDDAEAPETENPTNTRRK